MGSLHAALTQWTQSILPIRALVLESWSPSPSPAHRETFQGSPAGFRAYSRAEGMRGLRTCQSRAIAITSQAAPKLPACDPGTHTSLLLLPVFLQIQCKRKPLPSLCQYLDFVCKATSTNIPILSGNRGTLNRFTETLAIRLLAQKSRLFLRLQLWQALSQPQGSIPPVTGPLPPLSQRCAGAELHTLCRQLCCRSLNLWLPLLICV